MNKKIIVIAGVVLVVIVLVVFLVSTMLKNQPTTIQTQPTPTILEATITTAPGSTVANTTPGEDIKIAPTLLTPIPLPKTLGDLKATLEMPMNYKDISIRYSKGRDLFIVYYDGTIFGAQKRLGELLKQYGVNDPNSVSTEYVSNKAPLLEKPPMTGTPNQ